MLASILVYTDMPNAPLFLVFSHPRLPPEKYRTEWSAFEMNLVFIWRNFWGYWDYSYVTRYTRRERYHTLTKTGSISLDNIMCINRNVMMVIRLPVSGDWDLLGDQWEITVGQGITRKTNIFSVESYLHVSGVNYDGYLVMIDMMSTSKYKILRYTIAHGYWRRRMVEVMERVKKNMWIFWCDCWQFKWSHLIRWSCANGLWRWERGESSIKTSLGQLWIMMFLQRNQSIVDHHYADELSSAPLRFG